MRRFLFLLSFSSLLFADDSIKTPQQIQAEIDQSEADFVRAKKMFVPWYTGPLITPSPSMIPPATLMVQPYVFVNDNYAAYNNTRSSVSAPSVVNMNPLTVLQTGITENMDFLMLIQGNVNWRNGHSMGGFGDLVLSPGFLISEQTVHVPQFKFFVQTVFPTGKYQNLNPNGHNLDSVGLGSVRTQIGMILGKIILWQYAHPVNLRMAMFYTIPSRVTVHNFNAYGGGYGTNGIVYPGSTFNLDFGMELSLTERWVFAMDLVYTASGATRFFGNVGTTAAGVPATMGGPSNDNLSLAPAIEYNFSSNLGLIGGVQFSVYGRNSSNFVSGIISLCWVYSN